MTEMVTDLEAPLRKTTRSEFWRWQTWLTVAWSIFFAVSPAAFGAGAAMNGAPVSKAPRLGVASFAGGCFWCMEAPFDALPGVRSVTVGYTGGSGVNPTYEQVSAGRTGHAEAVQIQFDPTQISYDKLLQVFWRQIDPTNADGQFCDHGQQYRSAIFVHDAAQKLAAEASRRDLEASKRFPSRIVTEITAAAPFYPAEEYHQHYYKKNPIRYRYYRYSCGRDQFLEKIWGDDHAAAPH